MSNSSNKRLQLILENRKNQINEELGAAYRQKGYPINEVERKRTDSLINDLQVELQNIENELSKLHKNINQGDLQNNILQIDFNEAVEIINKFINQSNNEKNAALFLIQNTAKNAGEKCVARFREELRPKTRNFEHIPIRCLPSTTTKKALLDLLAGYFGPPQNLEDLAYYAQTIIEKICDRVQTGSIMFIELNCWSNLKPEEEILPWFITNFWQPLLELSPSILTAKDCRRVRFIVMITSINNILVNFPVLNTYCIKDWNDFNKNKVFDLQLQQSWSKEEIENWLDSYSGLKGQEISNLAQTIYSATDGNPALICHQLIEEMLNL